MVRLGLVFMFLTHSIVFGQNIYKQKFNLMGCDFGVTVVAEDSVKAMRYIDLAFQEMTRIEKRISSWDKNSETSKINRNSGIQPIKVSDELFNLIQRSIKISQLTDGAFDITFASIDKVWKFDGTMVKKPSEMEIIESVKKIGFDNIVLNTEEKTVFLKKKGSKIGFGGIGKGYAADKAKQLLMENGVQAGIINASGDMNTWGKQPDGSDWKIAITNPLNKEHSFATLPLNNNAVVTSGDYEKFVEFEGQRYAHIINPKTGYPTKGILSVTVFAPKAELADALATSVFVLGREIGLHRIDQLPNIECVIVDDKGKVWSSKHININ